MPIISPVAFPYVAGAITSESAAGAANFSFSGYTLINMNKRIPNSSLVYSIGQYLASSTSSHKFKIVRRASAGVFDVLVDLAITHPGSVFYDAIVPNGFLVPASGDFYVGAYYTTTNSATPSGSTVPRAFRSGIDATGVGITGFTEDSQNSPIMEFTLGV